MQLEQAAEVFISGFCYGRSQTHPYIPYRLGPLWVMRDEPRQKRDHRVTEIIALDTEVDEIFSRRPSFGSKWALGYVQSPGSSFSELKEKLKAKGVRLLRTEPMMLLALDAMYPKSARVRRIQTVEDLRTMQNAMGSKLIPERELEVDDAAVRLYGAYVEGQAVGVVKSVPVRNLNACWVSGLGVLADFQRQGFGRELMQTMLHDDQRLGFRHSVLLASKLGARLYPTLGYETLGTLSLWVPQRDADA